ncbi:MAG: uracil-DNA glycosylase, partial [Methylobacteriaceae bacterium]|nr:uracil-DNA glycosylase [Methylobacteriaceae bacterium]
MTLAAGADQDGFRHAVRRLVADEVPPDRVDWEAGSAGLPLGDAADGRPEPPPLSLPRRLADLIGEVVPHRDPERYGLLYDVVWRVTQGQREILEVASDPAMHRLDQMRKSVRRDIHKMHA